MVNESKFWGAHDDERLVYTSADDAIEAILDALEPAEFDEIGEVTVYGFQPMKPSPSLGWDPLDILLEQLDEQHGDPEGDGTRPTEAMRAAEKVFIDAVLAEYESWACEPSGEIVTVNALEWVREHRPGWLTEKAAV